MTDDTRTEEFSGELESADDDVLQTPCDGQKRRFEVPAGSKKMRLDAFLGTAAELSRSRVKKLVEQGGCLVDGAPCADADYRVRPGQIVELSMPGASDALAPEEGPLDIVYSDADIAVVNKPAGLTMHPCPSCPSGTLVHRMLSRFPQLALQEGPRPGIVHRLDKDTSGLVIVALSERARLRLIEDFAQRRVHKTYLAVTRGVPPAEGTSDLPIGRHPTIKTRMAVVPEEKGGRCALTRWSTLYASPSGRFALLAVRLFTGRTHQIRVHLAQAGFPLWGDAVYGPNDKTSPAARQLLHAWKLEFAHPVSGEPMSFTCPPPEDFPRAMLALERCMRRVILTGMPGCGKSAVLERMEARRIPVWSADKAVAAQYQPGADGWRLMRQRWGDAFFDDSGRVNRAALTRLLAETPGMRRELERMIHPLVRDSMETFFRKSQERGEGVAVAEVPLWFETGWTCPGADIAVIVCPDDVRHARLRETRSWSDVKIAAVESWQWKQEDKIAAADLLIRNDGTLDDLDREVGAFLDALAARQKSGEAVLEERWRKLWSGEEGQTRD
ncbi:dephospho-CoA kinase [uncultured Mailhella sp.]|uniref:dephospho-CoA kinase n=1 Tax=uncultured Mailhella sp. TaxID=1981031 RepID=UPI003208C0B0